MLPLPPAWLVTDRWPGEAAAEVGGAHVVAGIEEGVGLGPQGFDAVHPAQQGRRQLGELRAKDGGVEVQVWPVLVGAVVLNGLQKSSGSSGAQEAGGLSGAAGLRQTLARYTTCSGSCSGSGTAH